MKTQSPRRRILAGLGVVLAILIGTSAVGIANMQAFRQGSADIRRAHSGRSLAHETRVIIREAYAYDRAFSRTGDSAFFQARSIAAASALDHMQALVRFLGEASSESAVVALRAFEHQTRFHMEQHRSGTVAEPADHHDRLLATADSLLRLHEIAQASRLGAGERSSNRAVERAVLVTVVGTIFAIAVALAFAWLFQADVRGRLTAEEALRANEAQFRSVVGVLAEGVVLMNREGTVLGCNRAACDILGLSAEEVMELGKRRWHGLRPDGSRCDKEDHPALLTARTGVAQRGFVWGLRRRDGSRRWLLINSEPMTDKLGRLTGVVSSFNDITDAHEADAKLRAANDALLMARDDAEHANRTKSEFLAHMSHELRTPLNSVIGFANVLRANKLGNLMPDQLRYLERVHDNGRHLLDLINDVLDLSKVEAGQLELDVDDVALGPLVAQTVAQLEGQVKGKPVTLHTEVQADLQPLRADRRKLRQVIINLVANAIKFTPEGEIKVHLVSDGGRPIRLDVSDTGIGIPYGQQHAVFEAFQQGDSTSLSRQYGGSGLGLTITRSLLQLMGYHITFTSEPGKGSTFSVHFHAQETEMERAA